MNLVQRWRLKAERAAWRLDQPHVLRMAMWLVPVLFGLVSVALRQDSNWDLRNYHLYNPFAWLNGKVGFDIAPAQMQTYFNPTIDLLYYGLTKSVPPQLAGFIMGLIHGLNFLLLAGIARAALPEGPRGPQVRLPLCLALAGMLAAGFVAQLGNAMGDTLTALFVLGAVWRVLRLWRDAARGQASARLLLAGLVMGLGVGLKLTNGIYAPALCLALLWLPAPALVRIRAAFLFSIGVLSGIAITAGHWLWKMWSLFGNPLYPQFNTIFHSPLAGPVSVGDTRWMPHGLAENLLWPFIFALHPQRVSEITLSMVVWPILYLGFIGLAGLALMRRRPAPTLSDQSHVTALLVFFALSYLVWLNLFSIHRYLIPLELAAPLVVWLLVHRLFPRAFAGKIATLLILLVIACSVQSKNWGRVGWGKQAFSAAVADIPDPRQSMIMTVHVDPPMAWIATFYPRDLAFVSLVSGFDSDALVARFRKMVAQRTGPFYVMLIDSGADADAAPGQDAQRKQQGVEADQAVRRDASRVLAARGFQFAATTCAVYQAQIGKQRMYYRLCPVVPVDTGAAVALGAPP